MAIDFQPIENESTIDFQEYPENKSSFIKNLPSGIKEVVGSSPSMMMGMTNPKQAILNRAHGVGRGILDIGQGIAQATKQFKEHLGMNPFGSTNEYTRQKDAERRAYALSEAGRDPYAEMIRKGVGMMPYAALGPVLGSEASLLSRAALSGGTNAGINAMEYVPEGGSRSMNALKGGTIGAAIPFVMDSPDISRKVSNIFSQKNRSNEASKLIQIGHDKLLSQSQDIYNLVGDEVKNAGFKRIPITESFIDKSRKYLPKTDAVNSLIERAKTGDYEAVRDLQSDLGSEGSGYISSKTKAENHKGREALELREKINNEMYKYFEDHGREDLSKLLKDANGKYKKLNKVYHEKSPVISKLVHKEKREIPKNIFNVIERESVPMNRLLKQHPEVKKILDTHKKINKIKSGLDIAKWAIPAVAGEEYLRRNH